jgi:FkbM family methyltransferase
VQTHERDRKQPGLAYNPDLTCVFEPNPEAVQLVQTNLEGSERIRFFAAACWNVTGSIPFYPVLFSIPKGGPPERNIGASSCYRDARTCEERLFQTHITVEAIRLDELIAREGIGAPDLVCMDVQGSEAETLTMYMGEALLPEIEQYLGSYGFSRVAEKPANEFFGDYLFKNPNH